MSEDSIPTGIYWDRPTWDLARSAYVADLDADPEGPEAFVEWLHRAIENHAALTTTARAQLASTCPRSPSQGDRGFSKTHPLRVQTVQALERTIVDDRVHLGRVVSRSGFVREAVVAAAARSRERLGRDLPPAPDRLPNRPPRRRAASGS